MGQVVYMMAITSFLTAFSEAVGRGLASSVPFPSSMVIRVLLMTNKGPQQHRTSESYHESGLDAQSPGELGQSYSWTLLQGGCGLEDFSLSPGDEGSQYACPRT